MDAQDEYDLNPELQLLLTRAAQSPTTAHRRRARRRDEVWASNQDGGAGDSVADVRAMRDEDNRISDAKYARIASLDAQASDEEVERSGSELLEALGLSPRTHH